MFESAGGTQVHDFNPGEENGLFWTTPVSNHAVTADLTAGTASLTLQSFHIDDYGNVGNALSGGHEVSSGSLSLRLEWSGLTLQPKFTNASLATPFTAQELQAVNSGAIMSWSINEKGSQFSGGTNTADFAMLAMEGNGVFA